MTDALKAFSSMADGMHMTPAEVEQLRGYERLLGTRAANCAHELFLGLGLVEEKLGGPALTLKGRAVLRRLG
ncbi:hypothetical protein [Dongia deserti]|uniref:hypothetical protein n=1 Tax=Dongia deserti TaxID=2268030 RepID=UPI000E6482C6|nr:hypothetical protein [Dongia deserti]